MEIYIKKYFLGGDTILAACDKDLIGKKFSEGNLTLHVKESFYAGELIPIESLAEELKNATSANLTGKNVVSFAVENDFINEGAVLTISDVKHAQIMLL